MKNITILTSLVISLAIGVFSYAQEKLKIDTVVQTGYSDRDLKPFLDEAAAKWGEYFSGIYGECLNGHIAIRMESNGKSETFNNIQKASFSFAKELAIAFPLYTAQVEVFPAESEKSWHIMRWEAVNGELTSYEEN
ncbi:MAG: hypothetical protein PHP17_01150 [Candidatus Omnitrophica bacterium]|nr:hypothetical protein [Candidatus Omnitrophota bacterium]